MLTTREKTMFVAREWGMSDEEIAKTMGATLVEVDAAFDKLPGWEPCVDLFSHIHWRYVVCPKCFIRGKIGLKTLRKLIPELQRMEAMCESGG